MMTDMDRADKFKLRLQALINEAEFKNYNMFLLIKEMNTGEVLITGSMCMVCALEEVQEFVEDNNIKHFYTDDETKH